jgi:FMN phosphatase YigB (HAD superfamily)
LSFATLIDALKPARFDLLSTDIFDTVLLRDGTTESDRFARAARRSARILGIDPDVLTRLRWQTHDNAYRAVAIGRPEGEASLAAICSTMATALGLDDGASELMRRVEVDTDIKRLRPNRRFLSVLERAAHSGVRVVAVSDTYYGEADLWRIFGAVVGRHPIAAIYSSADLKFTKHAGGIFAEVGRREGVAPDRVLHVGDSVDADITMATAASWASAHLPRTRRYRLGRLLRGALSAPIKLRRTY